MLVGRGYRLRASQEEVTAQGNSSHTQVVTVVKVVNDATDSAGVLANVSLLLPCDDIGRQHT